MIQGEIILQGELVDAEAPPQPYSRGTRDDDIDEFMSFTGVTDRALAARLVEDAFARGKSLRQAIREYLESLDQTEAPPQAQPIYAQPPQPVYSQPAPVVMPPAAPQTVQVQIPAGMAAGSVFDVQANGQRIRVTVPAGGKAGQLLNVRVPQQRAMVQQPVVVQQPGQTIVVQQGGGRAHKYDASVLSGAWMMDNEACPGCCPWQVNIMAMGQDAFQFGPHKVMFTRDGGTDNFRSAGARSELGPCMALVLSENDIKLRGNQNLTLTKINRTNLVDRA